MVGECGFAGHIKATFDTAGNLTRLKTTRASSDADANRVSDLTYTYTIPTGTTCAGAVAGRSTATRHSVLDNRTGATTSYCYDSGERLTRAATTGGATYTYGYDVNGNRTSGPEGTHTYNAANQATDSGSAYDANGNLTTSTAYPTLAHNGLDQITSTTASGQAALAMSYAGATNDERTKAGTTTYQNGLLGVQTQATTTCTLGLLCNTVTASFVRDPQGTLIAERIGNDEYYYAFDGLGSVVALIDAAGTQRAAYTYDPYGGNHTATALNGALPPNPWRYAGGHLDPTGLYKYGARYYNPNIGRWTQQDSIVALGDPSNANRYAYAGDNPVNNVDPDGRRWKELLEITEKVVSAKTIGEAIANFDDRQFLTDLLAAEAAGFLAGATCIAAVEIATAGAGTLALGACFVVSQGVAAGTSKVIKENRK